MPACWRILTNAIAIFCARGSNDSADPTFIASVNVPLDLDGARKVVKLIDAIEDLDDVQNVYTNADIPDEIAEQLDAE